MKTPKNHPSKGFTLIELLVVIAIIGILAGLLFPAINSALKQAKRTEARAEAENLANAVMLFWNDYGKLPIPDGWHGGTNDVPVNHPSADAFSRYMIMILTAEDDGWNVGHQNNPREKVYFTQEEASSDGEFLDPWGTQYRIKVDRNLDNKIDYLSADDAQHRRKVIVVSAGPDRKWGGETPDDDNEDNVANVDLPEQ